jgi:hypothetical protein
MRVRSGILSLPRVTLLEQQDYLVGRSAHDLPVLVAPWRFGSVPTLYTATATMELVVSFPN